MITNSGKQILVKYILGQTPDYASHIALGCGSKPLTQMIFNATSKWIVDGTAYGYPGYFAAIITTSVNHNFVVGDRVFLSDIDKRLNGDYEVFAIPNATSIAVVCDPAKVSISDVMLAPQALSPTGEVIHSYSTKELLDFEMIRLPISSRGYILDGGIAKIVLTANIPESNRYEISEVGVFSLPSNPSAVLNSYSLFSFIGEEEWQHHDGTTLTDIKTYATTLEVSPGEISVPEDTFIANSNNAALDKSLRLDRQERPRNLGDSIFFRGDSSAVLHGAVVTAVTPSTPAPGYVAYTLYKGTPYPPAHEIVVGDTVTISGLTPIGYNGTFTVSGVDTATNSIVVANGTTGTASGSGSVLFDNLQLVSGGHIHKENVSLSNLTSAAPQDQLRLAFSVLNKTEEPYSPDDISAINIALVFSNTLHTPSNHSTLFAQMNVTLINQDGTFINPSNGDVINDFTTNRYFVVSEEIQNLYYQNNFNWNEADTISVYVSVLDSTGVPTQDYYVALDGLRFENTTSYNPLYGLTGYSVINNVDPVTDAARPVVKLANTSSFTEFRYSVDVV